MDKFFNYVNLKDILSNFVEACGKDLETPTEPQADEWSKLCRQMGRKFANVLLPKLFAAFEARSGGWWNGICSTWIIPDPGIAAAATVAQIDSQGDEAGVILTDPKTKDTLRFQMRRQPNHGAWQIVSVNYADLKRFSKREFHR